MVNYDPLRNQEWRLGVIRHFEEVTHNVSRTCRYFGISRCPFYRWQTRYAESGEAGLLGRSRRPIRSPRPIRPEVLAKIIYLRQTYHFEPWKIMIYLERYHDIHVSKSGIWRILNKLQMNELPVSQRYKRHHERWKRYGKHMPGHRIQVDIKFLERIQATRKRYFRYTAIDGCTLLRVLQIYENNNQRTAIQFINYARSWLPFRAEVIQTDNESEFQGHFHWHVLDKGINHVSIKPRWPRLNGKVEQSHRNDDEEFYKMLKGAVIDSSRLFNEKLREWEDSYNYHRPHSALAGMTPYERFRERAGLQV